MAILFGIDLSQIWTLIFVIQVFGHLILLELDLPVNLQVFLLQLFTIGNFDLFEKRGFTEQLFTFTPVDWKLFDFKQGKVTTRDFLEY